MSDLQRYSLNDLLSEKRDEIARLAAKYGAYNVRVFGSTVRGEATAESDIDFLVDFKPGYTLWDHIGLTQDLEDLLQCKVDVSVEKNLHETLRPYIMRDAVPLADQPTESRVTQFVKDQKFYLEDILERIGYIESYTASGKDSFMESQLFRDAVMRNFEVIGEAVKRLSDELKSEHPYIEWRKIAGFRDFLTHHYDRVDPQEVWKIVENDLQPLKQAVEAMLQQVSRDDSP